MKNITHRSQPQLCTLVPISSCQFNGAKDIMKTIMILVALCVAVLARPQETTPEKETVLNPKFRLIERQETHSDDGQYSFRYLVGDDTFVTEQGTLKLNANGTDYVLVKQGSYRYNAPDGTPIALEWIADEDGFRAVGNHLPVSVVSAVEDN